MQVLQNQGEGHHHFVWPEQQGTQNKLKKKKVITIWPEQQETHKSHGEKKKKQHGWWNNKSFSKILAFAECWMLQQWLCSIPEKKILKKGKSSWKEFTVVVCRNIEEVSQRKQEFSGEANKTMMRVDNRIMIIMRMKKNGFSNFFTWTLLGI